MPNLIADFAYTRICRSLLNYAMKKCGTVLKTRASHCMNFSARMLNSFSVGKSPVISISRGALENKVHVEALPACRPPFYSCSKTLLCCLRMSGKCIVHQCIVYVMTQYKFGCSRSSHILSVCGAFKKTNFYFIL